jgi:hypothetical protein
MNSGVRKLLRWTSLVVWLSIAAIVACLLYLNVHGFPETVCQFVRDEFLRKGYAVRFDRVYLNWLNGIVVHNLSLAEAKRPDHPIATVNEVALRFDWGRLWSGRNVIHGLRVSHASVAVPMPPDNIGSETFTATDASAALRFEDNGVIHIEQLTGAYCGIFLAVNGRIKTGTLTEQTPSTGPKRFAAISTALRELRRLRCAKPLDLNVEFDVDLAAPMALQARARLRGDRMQYRELAIDSLDLDLAMREGAITIQTAELKLAGGALGVSGVYKITGGEADLRATSTFDVMVLRPFLPADALKTVDLVSFQKNPHITVRYVLSPQTGVVPLLTGSLKTAGLAIHGVKFLSVDATFENSGPLVTVNNARVIMAEGELTGRGRYHIESSDFAYEFDSTLDPTKLLPLMTPMMQRWISPATFTASPHIVAKVRGDFVDPDLFAYDAEVRTGGCSYRGVALKSVSGNLCLRRNRLIARDLVLERDDGTLAGALTADFDLQQLVFNMHTTANPAPMAALLGPKAAATMEQYHFAPNLNATAKGYIDFARPERIVWRAEADDDNFSWWKLSADHTHANILFTNNMCRLGLDTRGLHYGSNFATRASTDLVISTDSVVAANVVLAIGNGNVRGETTVDTKRQRVAFRFDSTADPRALAAALGPVAAKKIEAFEFGANTIVHAAGIADLVRSNETTWTATLDTDAFRHLKLNARHVAAKFVFTNEVLAIAARGRDFQWWSLKAGTLDADIAFTNNVFNVATRANDFQWWKLKADAVTAHITGSNNAVAIRNVEAALCGGTFRGNANLLTIATNTEFHVTCRADDCSITRVLQTIGAPNTNASGRVKLSLDLAGNGGDVTTYRGSGNIEINNGVLLEVPLFGIFSRILNLIVAGLGSTDVTSARCDYTVTNGVVKTDNLQFDTIAATVTSHGAIGLATGDLDLRVEAQPLRSWPGINILTWMLGKIFEYKIGGSLDNPNWRPTRIPKEIMPHGEGRKPAADSP